MANVRRTAREIRLEAIIALQNELNQLKGEAPVDELEIRRYDGYKLYELGDVKESLQKQIEQEKQAQKVAAYFAGEGAALKEEIERKKEEIRQNVIGLRNAIDMKAEELFQFTAWTVESTSISYNMAVISISLHDEDDKQVWGTSLDIKYQIESYKEERESFTTNIGTCGSNDLLDDSRGSRTDFYIQVGELLKDKETLESMKEMMSVITNDFMKLLDERRKLEKVESNPFNYTLNS